MGITACDSKKNIETAVANSTEEVTIKTKEIILDKNETKASTETTTKKVEETTTKSEITTAKTEETTTKAEITTAKTEETTTKAEETTTKAETTTAKTEKSTANIASSEDNKTVAWSFKRNSDHSTVVGYNQGVDLAKYDTYYIGDTSKKVIYLTFDEGYEYGCTPSILDTLKANDVHATFFLTKEFIKSEPELSKRMAQDGHTVGNHSVNHPSLPDKTDAEIVYEIEETDRYYKEITGYEMDKFLRPPKGEFSARTLDITKQTGYKTILWSFAYGDWDVKKQPGKAVAYKTVMDNYHNGGIFLLHAVSQSNTDALDDIIKALKAEGYSFESLYNLP